MSTASLPTPAELGPDEAVRRVGRAREVLLNEMHKVVVGQDEMIEQMLIAMFAREHCLAVGASGLAKALTVSTLAQALHLKFSRIQFTPDLTANDIIGSEIIEEDPQSERRIVRFARGPIFANIILADEINWTPPKTQATLLQAMQEYRVPVAGNIYDLDKPFFVMATQNSIAQEGTHPLLEAQLDNFMLSINVPYPTKQEECAIVNAATQDASPDIRQVLRSRDIQWIQKLVREVPVADHLVEYAVDLTRATRPNEPDSPEFVTKMVKWGAGPRAAQFLILGAKARAILKGRFAVHPADIRAMAKPVLRHRISTNNLADADGITPDLVIEQLVCSVPEPAAGQRGLPPSLLVVSDSPQNDAAPLTQETTPPVVPNPTTTPIVESSSWPPGTKPE